MSVRVAWLAAVAISAGCAAEESVSVYEAAAARSPGDDCPVWGCGGNSPEIDFAGFHDLNERGEINDAGFRVIDFQKYWFNAWRSYWPDVLNGELVARSKADNSIVHSGAAIVGTRFTVEHVKTSRKYYLHVNSQSSAKFWALNGIADTPTYKLIWQDPVTFTREPVCGDLGDGSLEPHHAVLFDEERVDADAFVVRAPTTKYWFNIGCAKHALSKQHLMGYTKAAAAMLGVSAPTYAQRTANLKMLSADYCGTGDPFTVTGTDLHWRDRVGWNNTTIVGEHIEGIWNEYGAVCVGKPRVLYSPTPESEVAFPDGLAAELAEFGCTLPPSCTPEIVREQVTFPSGTYVISSNY